MHLQEKKMGKIRLSSSTSASSPATGKSNGNLSKSPAPQLSHQLHRPVSSPFEEMYGVPPGNL